MLLGKIIYLKGTTDVEDVSVVKVVKELHSSDQILSLFCSCVTKERNREIRQT